MTQKESMAQGEGSLDDGEECRWEECRGLGSVSFDFMARCPPHDTAHLLPWAQGC